MTDSSSLTRILQEVQPDELYNLAAQSHVQVSQRDVTVRKAGFTSPRRHE